MTVEPNSFSPDTSYAEAAIAVLQGGLGAFIDKAQSANKAHYEAEDEDNPGEPPYSDELCRAQELLTQVQERATLLALVPPKTEELVAELDEEVEGFIREAEDIGAEIDEPNVPGAQPPARPA